MEPNDGTAPEVRPIDVVGQMLVGVFLQMREKPDADDFARAFLAGRRLMVLDSAGIAIGIRGADGPPLDN